MKPIFVRSGVNLGGDSAFLASVARRATVAVNVERFGRDGPHVAAGPELRPRGISGC